MNNNEFYTVRGYQLLKQEDKILTSAMEDYLEMIYRNAGEKGYMRINALAELLNVKPSSATKMVQKLAELKLLEYQKYGIISLTESGKKYGEFLLFRHNVIERFLRSIGITENLLKETELIEHNISADTLAKIELLNNFFETNPHVLKEYEKFAKANM